MRSFIRSVPLTLTLTVAAIVATQLDASVLELRRGADLWRLVTCHFTHWSHEQLAWDALAFLLLGVACERRNGRAFHATLLASTLLIPLAVYAVTPNVAAYRGLSGIDSALFALLLIEARRSLLAMLCGIAFAAKIYVEMFTGSTIFVTDMGAGVVALPIAHVAGAVSAVFVSWARTYTQASCAFSSSCSSRSSP